MAPPVEKTILKYNKLFKDNNLKLRVVNWYSTSIVLNTSLVLYDIEKRKFRCRCKSVFALTDFDRLYAINNSETRDILMKKLKSIHTSKMWKEVWNNLPQHEKDKRSQHMRDIWHLCDRSKIIHPDPWNKNKTKYTDDRLMKNSINMTGNKNPSFGKSPSAETREKQSKSLKSKIKLGLFTPCVHNSRTHWENIYNDTKYRSSWEAVYAALNPNDLYEEMRLEYEYDGDMKIYIVDFINHTKRTLTEIKPKEYVLTDKNKCKFNAAKKWCRENNYTFIVLTQDYIIENYDNIPFDKLQIPNIENKLRKIKNEAYKKRTNQ